MAGGQQALEKRVVAAEMAALQRGWKIADFAVLLEEPVRAVHVG